jgi:hypothetical protein
MAAAGPEAESTSQWTAAHYAALNGHQFVLGALHDAGANLMAQVGEFTHR